MISALALGLVLLAAPKTLVEATRSTDSSARDRGAYALARSFSPSDDETNALVQQLLERGEPDQQAAIRRGLMERAWPGGRPAWLDAKMNADVTRRLTPTWEAFLLMPHDESVEIVLRQLRERGPDASGVSLAVLLDDERLREPLATQMRLKNTTRLFYQKDCTIEGCHAVLCDLAWLNEDLSEIFKRYDGREFIANDMNKVLIASVKACGKDSAATATVREASRTWADPLWRLRFLEYLWQLPGSPTAEAIGAAADLARDGDGRVRSRATELLSVIAGKTSSSAVSGALIYALKDTSPELRVEAAAGLLEMHAGAAEMAALRKSETDLAVKGLLEATP